MTYTRWIDKNSRIASYTTPVLYRGVYYDDAGRIDVIGDYQGTRLAFS